MPASLPLVSLGQAWEEVLEKLGATLEPSEIDSWFRNLSLVELTGSRAKLSAPSRLHAGRIKTHYEAVLLAALEVSALDLVVNDLSVEQALPLTATTSSDAATASPKNLRAEKTGVNLSKEPLLLNPEYSFGSFIVGPCNRFAKAAATGVAERPATGFNPLFIHGSVGLGKTHLAQAIAHQTLKVSPQTNIAFLSCEQFVNHFISSLQQGSLESFRNRYRLTDILIVDDIQLLSKKMRTQEEFFHTFNALHNAQKQIVLTSDAPPEEIPALQERLLSRFKWGLVVEIERPCFETRVAILQAKAEKLGLSLPEGVAKFIAENINDSVRDLEGTLTRLHALASLSNRPISMPLLREMMGPSLRRQQRLVRIENILSIIVKNFNISQEDLESKKRSQSIVFPRQIAMYLTRDLTHLSLEEIGTHFGNRDHSTVLYAVEKMTARRRVDAEFAATLAELERAVRLEAKVY